MKVPKLSADRNSLLRIALHKVIKSSNSKICVGRIYSGTLKKDSTVYVNYGKVENLKFANYRYSVLSIEIDRKGVEEAFVGDNVSFKLTDKK